MGKMSPLSSVQYDECDGEGYFNDGDELCLRCNGAGSLCEICLEPPDLCHCDETDLGEVDAEASALLTVAEEENDSYPPAERQLAVRLDCSIGRA